MTSPPIRISPDAARQFMVGQSGLAADVHPAGPEGVRALLAARRFIQLDPIDRIGPNADLVAMARVDGLGRGDVHRHLDGHAFEHFAKVRCIVPARLFATYRARAEAQPNLYVGSRERRLPTGVLDRVLAEVERRGPVTAADMDDYGRVEQIDWSGWKGTGKASTMALRVLAARCQVVVRSRRRGARVHDLPHRALPADAIAAEAPTDDGPEVIERVESAGLLPEISGPWWSGLKSTRKDGTVERLVSTGAVERVTIDGARRTYLAPAGFRDRRFPRPDGRMRILGPLDPLLWSRPLVRHIFDFEYLWEVYKPADQRRWGYYVTPLIHEGRLVGRFEGRVVDGEVVVERRWVEDGVSFDERAFRDAIERHAEGLSRPVDDPASAAVHQGAPSG